jgi:O-antigen/teichoic acid export membrane protein
LSVTQQIEAALNLEQKNTLPRNSFVGAVLTLLSGGVIAQILPYIATIMLAHLFEPTAFGSLALFSSISAAVAIAATGRYELAVLLPRKARDADALVLVAVILGGGVSILCALALLFIWYPFFSTTTDHGSWGALPLAIFAIVVYQTLMNWFLRQGLYLHITIARFVQAAMTALISIGLGWYGYHAGLIVGYVLGWVFAAILFVGLVVYSETFNLRSAVVRMKHNAESYSSHALYGAIPALLDTVSIFCVMFIIYHHYGNGYVGQYNLSKQFFYGPISLIVGAVGQVVLRESSQRRLHEKNDYMLFKRVFRYATYAAVIYVFSLVFIAPAVISIFFGSTWQLAGILTVILSAGYAMRLVVTPLSVFLVSYGAMSVNGAWQVIYFLSINLLFFFNPKNPMVFFGVFTGLDVVLYAIYFFLIWSVVQKKQATEFICAG